MCIFNLHTHSEWPRSQALPMHERQKAGRGLGTRLHSEANFILGASSIPDPPFQEVHLTPTAPRKESQSPDRTSRDLNQVLPGEDQGLNPLPGKG